MESAEGIASVPDHWEEEQVGVASYDRKWVELGLVVEKGVGLVAGIDSVVWEETMDWAQAEVA